MIFQPSPLGNIVHLEGDGIPLEPSVMCFSTGRAALVTRAKTRYVVLTRDECRKLARHLEEMADALEVYSGPS